MTTHTPHPPPAVVPGLSPPGPLIRPVAAEAEDEGPGRWDLATTPGWYRTMAALCLVLTAAFGATATVAGAVVRGSSATVETSTAPTLIAVQDLLAAVAEADAAATAVHLSATTGDEDRARRNLYLAALARAADQVEEVARLVGGDEASHDALSSIAVDLTTYSGLVEAARTATDSGDDGDGDQSLQEALEVSQGDIGDAVGTVTSAGRARFDAERDVGRLWQLAAVLTGLPALAALLWLQAGSFRRSNRVLSLPLVAATALVVAALALLVTGVGARSAALDNAGSGGYDAITATSAGQSAVFALQSELSLRLLGVERDEPGGDGADGSTNGRTGGEVDVDALLIEIDGRVADVAAGADSPREEAAAAELDLRWDRYRTAAGDIVALIDAGDLEAAVEKFQGDGLTTFNGVNTSLESVLADNRSQFTDGVSGAADAVGLLPLLTAALAALAGAAVLIGTQQRLEDYR